MNDNQLRRAVFLTVMGLFVLTISQAGWAQSQLDCKLCHNSVYQQWLQGSHANTQMDVADELAEERAGQSPDSVLYGSDAENCIACHSPIAVTVGGGMSEVQALAHFFTTTNGVFTASTTAADTSNWPHNWCTTCHNVPADHPSTMPVFGFFNSATTEYDSVANVSVLCGNCHGNLLFEDTDHLTYNAWKTSKHAVTQDDVADELAEERAGESPDSVLFGSDPENCIACHGPTAVLANGGMSEAEALRYFFTTQNDTFFASTASQNKDQWPDVSCNSCHNPHKPDTYSYFNSETKKYEELNDSDELCGQCHGNLRFPDTDHLSYNIEKGIGAIGVPAVATMPGVTCTDCHMYASDVDGSNSARYHGHSWAIFVTEEDGSETTSCTSCHSGMNAAGARAVIQAYRTQTQTRLDSAQQMIVRADSVLQGNTNSELQSKLEEAENNLFLVESDESGGFHNHKFQMDLLTDVIQKSQEILNATGVEDDDSGQLPGVYSLFQNYPNPLNPSTKIEYRIPERTHVKIEIFNVLGKRIRVLVDENKPAGQYSVTWNAKDDRGMDVPSGIYVYKITTPHFSCIKKMTLLK